MRERGDLKCFHEPFMYDYYINRKIRLMPYFEPESDRPVTYQQVRDMLLEESGSASVFLKDMSYYVMPHLLDDKQLGERLVNCFLIRNPVASIASYFKLDSEVTSEEIGLQAQFEHYDALCKSSEIQPVVVEAEYIRTNPRRVINALWDQIGLPRADHAFEWGNDSPQDWNQVAGWHGDVSASVGVRPITPEELETQSKNFANLSKRYPRMREGRDQYLPHDDALKTRSNKC